MLKELEEYKYNDTIPPKKEEVCIKIAEKIFLTYGNFSVITGAPKSRKSTFGLGILLSFLTKKEIFGADVSNSGKVILLDTEQSHYDFYKNMQRIKLKAEMKHLDGNKYEAYLMRMLTGQDILTQLDFLLLNDKSIKLVIIDSLTDLVDDINSILEAKDLIQRFKRISTDFNIGIVGLLHLSKTTNFSLGHLGSFIDRGSQSVINIEKCKDDPYSSVITSRYLRSDMDFDAYTIDFSNNNGTVKQIPKWKSERDPDLIPYSVHIEQLDNIVMIFGKQFKRNDLITHLKSRYEQGNNWLTQKLLPYMVHSNMIEKPIKPDNFYTINT